MFRPFLKAILKDIEDRSLIILRSTNPFHLLNLSLIKPTKIKLIKIRF